MATFDIVNHETGEFIFESITLDLAVAEISSRGWTVTDIDHYVHGTLIFVNCNR